MRTAQPTAYESAPGGRASRTGSASDTRLHGQWLLLARLAGGALLVFNLTVFVIGLPLYFAHYQTICSGITCTLWQLTPQSVETLQGLGLSATGYATVILLLGVVAVVVSCAIAGVIIFRKPDNWMGLLVAFLLVMQSTNYLTTDVAVLNPLFGPVLAEALSKCFNFLYNVTFILVFCLFPNGRFVPGFTRWVIAAFLIVNVLALAVPSAPASGHDLLRFLVLWGSFLCIVSVAQIYRYRQVSSPVERQQTKWVVYGLAWEIVIGGGIISLPYLFPSLTQAGSLYDLVTYLVLNFCATLFLALCFGGVVLNWLRRHPQRAHAGRLENEEYYIAQAFERFWQATSSNQRVEFSTLAAALRYLRASLNGAILDTLRAYARPREASRPVPGEPGEPHTEDVTFSSKVWDNLKTVLSNPREERLAYLLFHCGLKPREIMHVCPHEFVDVREVYGLRRTIMERVLRNADLLRWRLS